MYSHTRSLQVGDLTLSATLASFFFCVPKNLKEILNKTEPSQMQTAVPCLHMLHCYAYILDIICDKYICENTDTWVATITQVKMSGRQM